MSVRIIVEITNKLLRHVLTHEVSSSGSSLVLAKITYECECVHTRRAPQQHHNHCIHGHTHTICDFNQFYELLNEF